MKSEILVQCEHLTKIFPGKKALDDVNLRQDNPDQDLEWAAAAELRKRDD